MMTTIFLTDDHAVVRDGLRSLLEEQRDFKVIGVAANGREAVHQIVKLCPNVAILDIAMPEVNGLEAARQIHALHPPIQMIILSMFATTGHIFQALQAGVRGYLLKTSAGIEVVDAVRAVQAGRRYLTQEIQDRIIDDYVSQEKAGPGQNPLMSLTAREQEILQLVVEGKTTAGIATILSLSPKSVETYRSQLMRKLGIKDLPSLVKLAIQYGLTSLQ
jgi:DNA-binding NarL/FixJ family response regulator